MYSTHGKGEVLQYTRGAVEPNDDTSMTHSRLTNILKTHFTSDDMSMTLKSNHDGVKSDHKSVTHFQV